MSVDARRSGPRLVRMRHSPADRGASDGRVAMLVTVCLLILAIPGALVLHEMFLPKLPSVSSPVSGASPPPASTSSLLNSPGVSSPPPAPSSSALAGPPTTAAPPAPPTASPSLLSLGYAIPAAGPGYVVAVDTDGRVLAGSTALDMCGIKFASESQRVARLAVNYTDSNGEGPSLEVTQYTPAGAALAYNELVNGVRRCPLTYRDGDVSITKTVVEPPDGSLLPMQLSIVQSAMTNGTTVWASTIYQFDGPYLLATYSNPYITSAAALGTAVDLARKAAIQLRHALTGSSQPIISG